MLHWKSFIKGLTEWSEYNKSNGKTTAIAIPYYSITNRKRDSSHKVWVPNSKLSCEVVKQTIPAQPT